MTSEHWICVQTGDKGYYQFPRMLNLEGRLHALVTDFWCPPWLSKVARRLPSGTAQAMAGRFHPDLAGAEVKSFNPEFMLLRLRQNWLSKKSSREMILEENQWFVGKAIKTLERITSKAKLSLFTHSGIGCDLFAWAKQKGIFCVLHQINPGFRESDIVREEIGRWPGWDAEEHANVPPELLERRKRDWELADKILVNSEWSRQCLVEQGVPESKVVVVSLAYEGKDDLPKIKVQERNGKRVLWVGQVNLRKGIQYLVEAARLLQNENITFDVAGPIQITKLAMSKSPPNVRFLGTVSSTQRTALYQTASVFVLPTLSDGFAMTQLEAMSHGLPVIATPNCGRVVTHGVNGLIVPPRDSRALASAINEITNNPTLRERMSQNAMETVKNFRMSVVAKRLCAAITA